MDELNQKIEALTFSLAAVEWFARQSSNLNEQPRLDRISSTLETELKKTRILMKNSKAKNEKK